MWYFVDIWFFILLLSDIDLLVYVGVDDKFFLEILMDFSWCFVEECLFLLVFCKLEFVWFCGFCFVCSRVFLENMLIFLFVLFGEL